MIALVCTRCGIKMSRYFYLLVFYKNNTKFCQNLSILLKQLVELAQQSGHAMLTVTTGWIAKTILVCIVPQTYFAEISDNLPHQIQPVQSNDYDCGLWVLVWITAVLQGHVIVGASVDEGMMPSWRITLRNLMCYLSNST